MKGPESEKTRSSAVSLDRPNETIPSVDDPWIDLSSQPRRKQKLNGDRAQHRLYHGFFEDMLN